MFSCIFFSDNPFVFLFWFIFLGAIYLFQKKDNKEGNNNDSGNRSNNSKGQSSNKNTTVEAVSTATKQNQVRGMFLGSLLCIFFQACNKLFDETWIFFQVFWIGYLSLM